MKSHMYRLISATFLGVVVGANATAAFAQEAHKGTLFALTDEQLDGVTAGRGIMSQNEALSFAEGYSGLTDTTTYAYAGERYGSGQANATGIADEVADGTASTTLAIDDDPNDLVAQGFAGGVAVGQAVTSARTSGMVVDGHRVNIGVVRGAAMSSGLVLQDSLADTMGAANGDVVGAVTHSTMAAGSDFWMMRSRTIVVSVDIPEVFAR